MKKNCGYVKVWCNLWTVGFYTPDGMFIPESDHDTEKSAKNRTRWLSGLKAEYVYLQTGQDLYTVGFYDEFGTWKPVSDGTRSECALETHRLNGAD